MNTEQTKPEQRLTELAAQLAALPEHGKLPLSTTADEAAAIAAQRKELDNRITAIRTAAGKLAALPTLDADIAWRDFLVTCRAVLSAELLTIKSPIRDKAILAQSAGLLFANRLIDFGLDGANRSEAPIIDLSSTRLGILMAAAGYTVEGTGLRGPYGFKGSLKATELRIKTLTKRRAEAEAALDKTLISDEERAVRDAEDAVFHAAINSMNIKHDSYGGGLVAFTKEGDFLAVADMTTAQRLAFERFARAATPTTTSATS